MNKHQNLDKFDDHLFIAFSIIIGLAITSFLENIALIIKNWDNVELYYLQIFWAFTMFFYAIQFWWGLWKYQDIKWNFKVFLLFTGIAISLFLGNNIIFPEFEIGQFISLRLYYYQIHSWFFAVYCFWTIVVVTRSITVGKRPITGKVNMSYYVGIIGTLSLAIIGSQKYHEFMVFPSLGLMLLQLGRYWEMRRKTID